MQTLLAPPEYLAPEAPPARPSEHELVQRAALQTHRECRRALRAFADHSYAIEAVASGLIVRCAEAFHRLLMLQVETVDGVNVYEYGKSDYALYSSAWLTVSERALEDVPALSGEKRRNALDTARRALELLAHYYKPMGIPVDEESYESLRKRLADQEMFS